jgi:preprotein translocase subunit SecD
MMRQAALVVILCLVGLSCGTRTGLKGPFLVLKPILAERAGRLSDQDAAKHDAGIIAERFRLLGCSQLRVTPGEQSISVQFPCAVDDSLVSSVIGQRGALAFCLVQEERATYDALKMLGERVRVGPGADTSPSAVGEAEEGTLLGYVRTVGGDFGVDERDYPEFRLLLERARPQWPEGLEFLFGPSEVVEGSPVRRLYMLKAEPEMYGPVIEDARPAPYEGSDPSLANTWIVSFKLGRKDAAAFAQVTGMNVGWRLAIVIDSVVQSAPVIQDRIPDGSVMIAMHDTPASKARAMGAILATGMLQLRWVADTTSQRFAR